MNKQNLFLWFTVISSIFVLLSACSRLTRDTNQRIAFTSNRDGNDEIYVMNSDGTNQVNLTNHPSDDSQPVWSPDGTKIIFISDRDGATDIYIMNADGSNQTNLTHDPSYDYFPSWSPDSKRIIFVSYRDNIFSSQGDPVPEIYIMNSDGSSPMRLTENQESESHISWAPNSDLVVLAILTQPSESSSNHSPVKQIYTMDLTGRNPIQLTQMPYGNEYPVWSPDGKQIAFMSYRDKTSEIYVMNTDGSNQTRLTFSDAPTSYNLQPIWSSNGSHIAFVSNRDGNYEVYVMNADGSNQTRLTSNASLDAYPAWSP